MANIITPDCEQTARIGKLNDMLRDTFLTGKVVMTEGISNLPDEICEEIITQVCTFDEFTPDNDPHGEHDFGSFTVRGYKVFWKIDYTI